LVICPDLWNDQYKKMNYLGLTAYFVTRDYELHSFDLCCAPYNEADKTGESVLQVRRLVKHRENIFKIFPSRLYVNN
jgi:hypothetical protein